MLTSPHLSLRNLPSRLWDRVSCIGTPSAVKMVSEVHQLELYQQLSDLLTYVTSVHSVVYNQSCLYGRSLHGLFWCSCGFSLSIWLLFLLVSLSLSFMDFFDAFTSVFYISYLRISEFLIILKKSIIKTIVIFLLNLNMVIFYLSTSYSPSYVACKIFCGARVMINSFAWSPIINIVSIIITQWQKYHISGIHAKLCAFY